MTASIQPLEPSSAELTLATVRLYMERALARLEQQQYDDARAGWHSPDSAVEAAVLAGILDTLDGIEHITARLPMALRGIELGEISQRREECAALGGRVVDCLTRENELGLEFHHITSSGKLAAYEGRMAQRQREHAAGIEPDQ